MAIFPQPGKVRGTLKTVKQEESIIRSRFIDCPQCKTRGLKVKRIVQAGRCRNCRESYKIIIQFVKTGGKNKQQTTHAHTFENRESGQDSTLPSWQVPSDSSFFGSPAATSPSFHDHRSRTHSEQ